MAATPKINFLTLVSYSLLQTVLAKTYRFNTIQNVTDDRQTTDRLKLLLVSILTTQSDNTHMVCC